MSYANCIVPGDNSRIIPEPKDTGPPEGFIDSTVKVYKIIDGVKTLVRTEDPFPEGWDKPGPFKIANKAECEERRGEEMGKKVKLEKPANLEQVWIDSNYKIDKVAKNIGAAWAVARRWLQEAELIDVFGTRKMQTSDPAQAANQEPDQSEASADTSIPEKEITVKDVLLYEIEQQDDFTAEDEEPIPYVVVEQFDLAPVKIQLICAALAEYREGTVPANITIQLVRKIGDIEVAI